MGNIIHSSLAIQSVLNRVDVTALDKGFPCKSNKYKAGRSCTFFKIIDDGVDDYRSILSQGVGVVTARFSEQNEINIELLSRKEQLFAARIKDSRHRSRFIISRTFLRNTIGSALNSVTYDDDFIFNKAGKPSLSTGWGHLAFNLSHTRDYLIVALTLQESIGVDIEMTDRAVSQSLLEYVFTPNERKHILASSNWKEVFLRGWTYKEAVLKCMGTGFTRDPKTIEVPLDTFVNELKAYALSGSGEVEQCYRLLPMTHLNNTIGSIAIVDG